MQSGNWLIIETKFDGHVMKLNEVEYLGFLRYFCHFPCILQCTVVVYLHCVHVKEEKYSAQIRTSIGNAV